MIVEDNIVRIARDFRDPKAPARYLEATVRKFSTEIYNKYYCVKLTFHRRALGYVEYIVGLLNNSFKVQIKECKKLEEGFDTGRGIIPDNCWEITLTKLRILEDEDLTETKEELENIKKSFDLIRNS